MEKALLPGHSVSLKKWSGRAQTAANDSSDRLRFPAGVDAVALAQSA